MNDQIMRAIALLFVIPSACAANLGEVYQLARSNDAVYAAAQESYKAGVEALPQARAGLLPNVSLSANYRHNETETSLTPQNSFNSRGYTLSLVQPLFRMQNLEAYEQGKLQALQAEQQLKVAEQDLLLRTAQVYFDVLQAQDTLATAQAQKQAYAEQLAQARRSFEVGAATIVDTHEAQARFDLATAQELAAQNDLEVKRRALEKLVNGVAPPLARLDEKAGLTLPQPNDMEAWVKQAREDSLAVALGRTGEEIARREVAKQRGAHYPTLDIAASYTDSRNIVVSGLNVDSKNGVVGLELAVPLFQGGAISSRARQAAANLEKARMDLENIRRQVALDTRQSYLGVVSGEARSRALEQALVSSESQLKSTKLGLEVGVRTRVDVLNAQQQLYTTRRDLAAARYQTLVAGLQLKAAAGALSEADLKAIDGLLKDD